MQNYTHRQERRMPSAWLLHKQESFQLYFRTIKNEHLQQGSLLTGVHPEALTALSSRQAALGLVLRDPPPSALSQHCKQASLLDYFYEFSIPAGAGSSHNDLQSWGYPSYLLRYHLLFLLTVLVTKLHRFLRSLPQTLTTFLQQTFIDTTNFSKVNLVVDNLHIF